MTEQKRDTDGVEQPDRGTLADAVGRAAKNAYSSDSFKPGRNHVVARGFEKSVRKPWAELTSMIGGVAGDVRKAAAHAKSQPRQADILQSLTDTDIEIYKNKMHWSWFIYQCGFPVGFLCLAYSTTMTSLPALGAFTSGFMVMLYSAMASLRVSRDVVSVAQRRQVSFIEVIDKIDQTWRPFGEETLVYQTHKYTVIPATIGAILTAMYFVVTAGGQ